MNDEMLKLKEVAELLHVDVESVRRWIKKGSLEAFRVGQRSLYVKKKVLETFIESRRVVNVPKEEPQINIDEE